MPTVRNARSLVTSRELPSGLQIWMKGPLFCLLPFEKCIVLSAVGTMNADTDNAFEESVKEIPRQSNSRTCRPWYVKLYVRLMCPTMDNRHNKLSQVPEFLL